MKLLTTQFKRADHGLVSIEMQMRRLGTIILVRYTNLHAIVIYRP